MTTHCTMKCKHCNTGMPYFTQKTHMRTIDFATFKEDMDRLLSGVDYILLFGFVGGEPLLAKDLPLMVDYAVKQKKIHSVFIATNCTILPSQALLDVMKNEKFSVQVSDYTDVTNLPSGISCHHDEFVELLEKNSIKYNDPQRKAGKKCFQTMPKLSKDQQDVAQVQKAFDTCFCRGCNMFCDGKLTECTISVYISRNMELTSEIEDEIVDIRTSTNVRRDLIRFYSRPYSAFCHYCHFENMQTRLPCGEQVEDGPGETAAAQ